MLQVLRRRFGVLLLVVVLVPAAAFVFSILQDKQYTAKATLLFRDPQLGQQLFGSTLVSDNSNDAAREAATNLELVSLDAVASKTAQALGDGFTRSSIAAKVSVSSEGEADVISIVVSGSPKPTVLHAGAGNPGVSLCDRTGRSAAV